MFQTEMPLRRPGGDKCCIWALEFGERCGISLAAGAVASSLIIGLLWPWTLFRMARRLPLLL